MAGKVVQLRGKQSESIRKMVVEGMLSAITAVLVFTPIGMIPLPPPLPAVTAVHIPVILAALVEGPAVGLMVGLVFGVCSLIRAWETGMVGLTLFFRNPLVSVLPRLLVPLMALGCYWLWKKLVKQTAVTDKIGVAVAAAVGAVTNTVCCLGMIVLLYGQELTDIVNEVIHAGKADAAYIDNAAGWLVAAVGLPNGIAEAIVAVVLLPLIKIAVDMVNRRGRRGVRPVPKENRQ